MKTLTLFLLVYFIAAAAPAQYTPDSFYEKRYQALSVGNDLFWMDSTHGDLWRLDRENMKWLFLGSPRGASTKRKGTYLLKALLPGELIVLNAESGEAWWTDGEKWIEINDPSTRTLKK